MTIFQNLALACAALAGLTFIVSGRMYYVRIGEMRSKRIHPQSVALSGQRDERLSDTRASDNYKNLFELPVLFYALCAVALGTQHVPSWLPIAAWAFVAARAVHSVIQCSYNKVMHRFYVFLAGLFILAVAWAGFALSLVTR